MFTVSIFLLILSVIGLALHASYRISTKSYPNPFAEAADAHKKALANEIQYKEGNPVEASWLNVYPPRRKYISCPAEGPRFFFGTSIPFDDLTDDNVFCWVMWDEYGYELAFECDIHGVYGEKYDHAALLAEYGEKFDYEGEAGLYAEPIVTLPNGQTVSLSDSNPATL